MGRGAEASRASWLESVVILRETLWLTAVALWAHTFPCARLKGPSSHVNLAFQVVLREAAGRLVHAHMCVHLWVLGALCCACDKLLGPRGPLAGAAVILHELGVSDYLTAPTYLLLPSSAVQRGAENLSHCSINLPCWWLSFLFCTAQIFPAFSLSSWPHSDHLPWGACISCL